MRVPHAVAAFALAATLAVQTTTAAQTLAPTANPSPQEHCGFRMGPDSRHAG